MLLHVQWLAQTLAWLGGGEDAQFHPFVHRHLPLLASAVRDDPARFHFEPVAGDSEETRPAK